MALSDTAIRKAKGRERPYRMSDERGLYLLVQPDGARWWRLDFSLNRKRRTMSLGVYPDVELGDARKERDRLRKLIKAGIDPVKQRRTGAGEAEASFKAVALQWFDANREDWSDATYNVKKRRFEQHVFPEIGHQDIRTIEPPEMLRVIRQIEDRGATDLPRRMRADCGSVFRFAIASGWQYDTYLTALPGDLLSDIYGRYGTQLLELNVRAFLGVRGRKTANAGLRDTLMKTPDRFLAFNNGIVATADAIGLHRDPVTIRYWL